MLNRKSAVVALISIGIMGCSSQETKWRPYSGTTPAVGIEYASDVCDIAGQQASSSAENGFQEKEVAASSYSTAIAGSFINSTGRARAGSRAYDRSFRGCMAKYGFQLYTVEKETVN